MTIQRKTLKIELKQGGKEGEFRAVFATFNVVDHDSDVTLPGSFKDGQEVRICQWGHDWWALPVGKGVIHQNATEAWVDGEFFLDTTHGKDTYLTVKGLGGLQEWSYAYEILASSQDKTELEAFPGANRILKSLDTIEVSPVLLGAGIGTYTEAIKAARLPFADHFDRVLAEVKEFRARASELASLRGKEGRTLSATNRDRLQSMFDAMSAVAEDLEKFLEDNDPSYVDPDEAADAGKAKKSAEDSEVLSVFLASQRLQTELIGLGITPTGV